MPDIENIQLNELGVLTSATTITQTGKVGVDTSGGTFTLTLASQLENKKNILFLYDATGNLNTNNVTVEPATSTNINGSASATLSTNWKVYTITYTGSAYVVG